MSARRIARELAVILFPQLPKDASKLEKLELGQLVTRATQMLTDYAKQALGDADALYMRASKELTEIEVEHPENVLSVDELIPVKLTSKQLREQLDLIDRAIHLVSEALDVPEMGLEAGGKMVKVSCKKCGHVSQEHVEVPNPSDVRSFLLRLVTTYREHPQEIDQFIRQVKAKWKVERMVSIDRDILRLACTETFYMDDIPIPVAINEAVELSHRFADERAAKFINGILRDIAENASHFRKTGKFLEQTDAAASSAEDSRTAGESKPLATAKAYSAVTGSTYLAENLADNSPLSRETDLDDDAAKESSTDTEADLDEDATEDSPISNDADPDEDATEDSSISNDADPDEDTAEDSTISNDADPDEDAVEDSTISDDADLDSNSDDNSSISGTGSGRQHTGIND